MKHPFLYALFFFALTLFFTACQTAVPYPFSLSHEGETFQINSEKDLYAFAERLSGVLASNLETVVVEKRKDEQGEYPAVKAVYAEKSAQVTMIVPLIQSEGSPSHYLTDCIMSCSMDPACGEEAYLITRRCATHSCGCPEGKLAGAAKVVF